MHKNMYTREDDFSMTCCMRKGPFTRHVSGSISATVTVKVYHCTNGDGPFDDRLGFEPILSVSVNLVVPIQKEHSISNQRLLNKIQFIMLPNEQKLSPHLLIAHL